MSEKGKKVLIGRWLWFVLACIALGSTAYDLRVQQETTSLLEEIKEIQSSLISAPQNFLSIRTEIRAPRVEDHYLGSPEATIVLIVYSDYLCPACSSYHALMQEVVKKSNHIAVVYRHHPVITRDSPFMAQASECMAAQRGEAGYWDFTNTVYERHIKRGGVAALVKEVKGNSEVFDACMARPPAERIQTDSKEIRALLQGTPFTIVHNRITKTAVFLPQDGLIDEVLHVAIQQTFN